MGAGQKRAAGDRVGPYEIARYLASGGMGDVYVAREVATGGTVALKFLADASPAGLVRFEREGRIAASIQHPHIVAGRGLGRADDGAVYIAMEFLVGTDLEARLRTTGVSPAESVAIAMQVCDALEHAHARRIVHRDLKPQNIFLCDGPALHAKVLDFGIARLADDRRLTGTGMMVGTWSHMSPEQARSETDIDARADLWSLGVVLYECLGGRLPFAAPTAPSALYNILFEQPAHLGTLAPHLPHALIDLVHRALSKSRDDRPPSAAAMRAALAAVDPAALVAPRVVAVRARRTPDADDDAVAAIAPTGVGPTLESDAGATVENRLTSVVFLRGAREPALVQDLANELHGRLVAVGDDLLVVFGTDRWNGDEPDRAVRLAAAVAAAARGIGVATGRALRSTGQAVTGAAVDAAFALSRRDGIALDATTAQIVRGGYALTYDDDGTARLDPRAKLPGQTSSEAVFATPLLGRDAELAMLVQRAEAAAADLLPTGVVIVAPSGLGKTRLRYEATAELLRRVPTATVLLARCEAFRRDAPFAALADALRDVVDASVGRVFAAVAHGTGDPVAALDRARSSLEAVLRGLAAHGPVVLAIDDVQWLDPSSRAAIRWVCENTFDLPLAFWLFGRLESRDAAMAIVPGAAVVDLKPLARPLAEKLLRAIAGAAPDALLDRAGGHPLFLEELGRIYAARGADAAVEPSALPPSIEGAHLAQLDQLDPAEREFLKRAAVFGRTAWLDAVVTLGADGAALERLRRANLLVSRPRSRFEPAREFAFRGAVMQEVAYGLWTEEQRARLHERAAQWLAAREGVTPDELARHWDLAGDHARAAEAYTAAAEASAHVADAATTCAHADRALSLTRDSALRWRALVARDNALQAAGDRAVQRSGLDELRALAATLGVAHQAEAAFRACFLARIVDDREHAVAEGARAIALATEADAPQWGSAAHNELAILRADEGAFADAMAHALAARRLADKTRDAWLVARSTNTQAYVLVARGNPGDALELYELAAARYSRAGDRRREALVLANAAGVMPELGRVTEACALLESAIEASRRVGNARTVAAATHNLGTARRILGDVAAARAHQAFAAGEASRMGYHRLAASVAVEALYLAMLDGAAPASLVAAATAAETLAEQTRSPDMAASARAAGLRARVRAGVARADAVRAARAMLPAVESLASTYADLCAAIFEAGDGADEDLAAAREALARAVARVDTPEERTACRATYAARFLLPDAVVQRADEHAPSP